MEGTKMIRRALLGAGMALLTGIATPALAQDSSFEIGTLTCKVVNVTNLILYTNEKFACDFAGSDGLMESYGGKIGSIGVNLSIKKDFTIVWAVIAPTDDKYQAHSLRGAYVGASADVALGLGAGAKVLVGGGANSFTLQPISVAGVKGAGAAVGIQRFRLE
jgi:hypothetical protein